MIPCFIDSGEQKAGGTAAIPPAQWGTTPQEMGTKRRRLNALSELEMMRGNGAQDGFAR